MIQIRLSCWNTRDCTGQRFLEPAEAKTIEPDEEYIIPLGKAQFVQHASAVKDECKASLA